MRLSELIELLQDIADANLHTDPDVRLAHQPSWPFEYSLSQVVSVNTVEDDEDAVADSTEGEVIVYIGEGSQLGYLPGVASRELGWR